MKVWIGETKKCSMPGHHKIKEKIVKHEVERLARHYSRVCEVSRIKSELFRKRLRRSGNLKKNQDYPDASIPENI